MFHAEKGLWVKIKREWEKGRKKEEGGIALSKEERDNVGSEREESVRHKRRIMVQPRRGGRECDNFPFFSVR